MYENFVLMKHQNHNQHYNKPLPVYEAIVFFQILYLKLD